MSSHSDDDEKFLPKQSSSRQQAWAESHIPDSGEQRSPFERCYLMAEILNSSCKSSLSFNTYCISNMKTAILRCYMSGIYIL